MYTGISRSEVSYFSFLTLQWCFEALTILWGDIFFSLRVPLSLWFALFPDAFAAVLSRLLNKSTLQAGAQWWGRQLRFLPGPPPLLLREPELSWGQKQITALSGQQLHSVHQHTQPLPAESISLALTNLQTTSRVKSSVLLFFFNLQISNFNANEVSQKVHLS